jgi:uncharacterized membrane protein
MKPETTWQTVGVTWRTDEHRALPLRERVAQRVHRQSRRLRIILACEIAFTIVMLVIAFTIVARNAELTLRLSAIVLLYTAGVWAFALWNRRGVWRPFGETTAEFVQLLRVRAERRIRSARFTQVVMGLALLLFGRDVAMAWSAGFASTLQRGLLMFFGLYSIGIVAWSIWYERKARRELRELADFQRQRGAEVARVAE